MIKGYISIEDNVYINIDHIVTIQPSYRIDGATLIITVNGEYETRQSIGAVFDIIKIARGKV